jgi:hypothetical protein
VGATVVSVEVGATDDDVEIGSDVVVSVGATVVSVTVGEADDDAEIGSDVVVADGATDDDVVTLGSVTVFFDVV